MMSLTLLRSSWGRGSGFTKINQPFHVSNPFRRISSFNNPSENPVPVLRELNQSGKYSQTIQYFHLLRLSPRDPSYNDAFQEYSQAIQKYKPPNTLKTTMFQPQPQHYFFVQPVPLSQQSSRKINWQRILLLGLGAGLLWWFFDQNQSEDEKDKDKGKKSKRGLMQVFANKEYKVEKSNVRFTDVIGIDEVKEELKEVVDYLRNPQKYTEMGAHLPKGVLLVGPPGTGKTLMARAVSGEAGVPFFYTTASEFDEMFVGLGAKRIRQLFDEAKKNAPSIIFVDELDAIGPRGKFHPNESLMQLLTEMDGFEKTEGVVVIAATNSPSSLDPALKRPGRFDKQIFVSPPDVKGRLQILEFYLKKTKYSPDINLLKLAQATIGMTGADLSNIINLAAIKAASEGSVVISDEHLRKSYDDAIMGVERKSAVIPKENLRRTAFHEGGHALVGLLTPHSRPIYKASIIPRGHSLGMVTTLIEDEYSVSRQEMMAQIAIALGGRAAEEIVFGKDHVTTGASSDFRQATQIAQAMMTQMGMNKAIGLVHISPDAEVSETMKAKVEEEVRSLLKVQYEYARNLLSTHKKELDLVAESLLEFETLSGDELKEIIKTGTKPKKAIIPGK